jgi:hypothetical protein
MAKRKRAKGQATIYKTLHKNKKNTNLTKNRALFNIFTVNLKVG